MPLKTEKLFLNINALNDLRLVRSREDPTALDPGPLWIEGNLFGVELLLVEVRGQEVAPIAIPAGYTCTLSAVRLDGANATEIFSAELSRNASLSNGNPGFTGTIDLTGSPVTATLAIVDDSISEGVRLRVQALIAAADDAEILRTMFQAVLRANIDPAE